MAMTLYEKPTWSKCREAVSLLKSRRFDFTRIDYYTDPLDEATLTRLLKAMALSPRDLIRTNEAVYKNLDLKNLALSDQELIALMVEHPDLVQRPILEVDGRAVLGRPPECILDLLSATPK